MPPRERGRECRGRQPPARERGRGTESLVHEGLMTRTNAAVPPPAAPRTGLDPTTAMMWESFKALMQTFVATQ